MARAVRPHSAARFPFRPRDHDVGVRLGEGHEPPVALAGLSDILAIAVLAYVSGGDGFRDMERYGRKHAARLGEFLELRNGVPSHDTFRRVLSMLRPSSRRRGSTGRTPRWGRCAWT